MLLRVRLLVVEVGGKIGSERVVLRVWLCWWLIWVGRWVMGGWL